MRLAEDERIEAPDDLYQMLVEAHDGLDAHESRQLDARLVLLLANHIGDVDVMRAAVMRARATIAPEDERPG